jgi:hypothetical protein
MALDTLENLKSSALTWIEHVNEPAATGIVDDCVALCEARVNKLLRLPRMETEAQLTLTSPGTADLPSDFLAMKRVVADYGGAGGFDEGFDEGFEIGDIPTFNRTITYAEPGWYKSAYPSTAFDGSCSFYTITGTTFRSQTSPVGILYYARIPPLATTDPNWLLTAAPDVYLYGTCLELLNALEGDAGKYAGLFNEAIESLIRSETFSRGGVLEMRASGPAP